MSALQSDIKPTGSIRDVLQKVGHHLFMGVMEKRPMNSGLTVGRALDPNQRSALISRGNNSKHGDAFLIEEGKWRPADRHDTDELWAGLGGFKEINHLLPMSVGIFDGSEPLL